MKQESGLASRQTALLGTGDLGTTFSQLLPVLHPAGRAQLSQASFTPPYERKTRLPNLRRLQIPHSDPPPACYRGPAAAPGKNPSEPSPSFQGPGCFLFDTRHKFFMSLRSRQWLSCIPASYRPVGRVKHTHTPQLSRAVLGRRARQMLYPQDPDPGSTFTPLEKEMRTNEGPSVQSWRQPCCGKEAGRDCTLSPC